MADSVTEERAALLAALPTSEELGQIGNELLQRRGVDAKMIHCMVGGSVLHGLDHSGSDQDFIGVYLFRNDVLFGINGRTDGLGHHTPDNHSGDDTATNLPGDTEEYPDHCFHEAGKFGRLLLKGNWTAIEWLFAPIMAGDEAADEADRALPSFSTQEWMDLRSIRTKFVSKRLVDQYLGYIHGNARRMLAAIKRDGDDANIKPKMVYHLHRLLFEARSVIDGGQPHVMIPDGETRDRLFALKIGTNPDAADVPYDAVEFLNSAKAECKALRDLEPWPNVPDEPDADAINAWLIKARITAWPEWVAAAAETIQ